MTEQNKILRKVFEKAIELGDLYDRAKFIEAECGEDENLYRAVLELVKAHELAGSFLDQKNRTIDRKNPSFHSDNHGPNQIVLGRGTIISQYKLLQQIGTGGMGVVWMAEQEQPVRRRVAIKLILGDIGNQDTIARFEAERQALAMMEHPNIARVFDAGTTEGGTPWFVMELVRGIPVTQYCDENKLGIRERLELMVPVCRAVQHAHHKGIVHRDLKPSNVLVTLYDGQPVPKIIDFGLAKALAHQVRLTDKTLFTEFGKVVGTLQYMSPEQAELNALDVDTRTDIYSLGVLLYELLTGTTPIEKSTIGEKAVLQVLAMIKEAEPPRPSIRLSQSGNAVVGISNQRQIAPSRLRDILRGELDWIVMKALEKDRTRRYETANSLAADIKRHLNGDSVEARPPSTLYQTQKFFRRNKVVASTALVAFAFLVAGTIISSWFAFDLASTKKNLIETQDELKATLQVALKDQNEKEAALKQVVSQQEEISKQQYMFGLQKVSISIENGDLNSASDELISLPQHLRGWEWKFLSTRNRTYLKRTEIPKNTRQVCHSPFGRFALLESNSNRQLQLFDTEKNVVTDNVLRLKDTESAISAAMSCDGVQIAILVATSATPPLSSKLIIWNRKQKSIVWSKTSSIEEDAFLFVGNCTCSHDGRRIFVSICDTDAEDYQEPINFDSWNSHALVRQTDKSTSYYVQFLGVGGDLESNENGMLIWKRRNGAKVRLVGPTRTQTLIESPRNKSLYSRIYKTGNPDLIAITDSENTYFLDALRATRVLEIEELPEDQYVGRRFYRDGRCFVEIARNELVAFDSLTLKYWKIGAAPADVEDVLIDEQNQCVRLVTSKEVLKFPLPINYEIDQMGNLIGYSKNTNRDYLVAGESVSVLAETHLGIGAYRDLETGKIVAFKPMDAQWFSAPPHSDYASISPSEVILFLGESTKTIKNLDLPNEIVNDSISSLIISEDHTKLAIICSADSEGCNLCCLIDIRTGSSESKVLIPDDSTLLRFSKDSVFSLESGRLVQRNANKELIEANSFSLVADDMSFSPDGNVLAAVNNTRLDIYSFPSMRLLNSIELPHGRNNEVKWVFNSSTVLVSSSLFTTICRLDLGSPVLTFERTKQFHASPTGSSALVDNEIWSSIPFVSRWEALQENFRSEEKFKEIGLSSDLLIDVVGNFNRYEGMTRQITYSNSLSTMQKIAALRAIDEVVLKFRQLDDERVLDHFVRQRRIQRWAMDNALSRIIEKILAMDENWIPNKELAAESLFRNIRVPLRRDEGLSTKIRCLTDHLIKTKKYSTHALGSTLIGIAYYRLGEFEEAVSWLNRSTGYVPDKQPYLKAGFQAMSNLKLGNINEASGYRKLFEDNDPGRKKYDSDNKYLSELVKDFNRLSDEVKTVFTNVGSQSN